MRKTIIFIIILGVFVGILGFYYYQRNVYSKGVLKLEILGQDESDAFDEIEYVVKYKNNGNTTLEQPELTFQFPDNSVPSEGNSLRIVKDLEDIYPGEEKTVSFKGRLFGKENDIMTAEASLKYKPKNLNAFYTSDTTFTTKIKSTPLTFELDIPSRAESGREVVFSLNYFSNADWPLSNLRAKIEYPSGFEFSSSQPQALEKSEWDLPILNKAEGGRIQVKGTLSGDVGEQKVFKATLGRWQDGQFILLKEANKGVEILKSSLSVFQQINGSSQYLANAGDSLHYEVFFRNLSGQPFQNLFLVVTLTGDAFDFNTIKSQSGQFNQGDNSLVWDWRQIPQLRFLDQGEEGKVEFWVNLKNDLGQISGQTKNFSVKDKIIISQTTAEFETKINSRVEFSQKGLYQDEVFGNSGPFPPAIGETTTFTIMWQVKNYYNDLKGATVRARLSPRVKMTGEIFPEDARLTYDSQSKEIVWELGDLPAGTGVSTPPPNVAFQISFAPEISQQGETAVLVSEAKFSGDDEWTDLTLQATGHQIDTAMSDDPSIPKNNGIIQ